MIEQRIGKLIDIDWQGLEPLQPNDVKINENKEALKKSLLKNGFVLPFAVWKENDIYYCIDGHTRKQVLMELLNEGKQVPDKLKAFEVEAKDRQEAIQILVEVYNQKHNPFNEEVLIEWLEVEEVEVEELDSILVKEFENLDEDSNNLYTKKIESPVYEAKKDKKPNIEELFNNEKFNELISEIEISTIPKEIKDFLKLAATRHIQFDYSEIAEFYAQSNEEVQNLMENSALVIIDFNKAIEKEFVLLKKEIQKQYLEDYEKN